MKKSMSKTRRLLAFLLAFALVLGYVPALNVTAATSVTAFTLEVTRTSQETPVEGGNGEETTEEATEEATEETPEEVAAEDDTVATEITYTYTAKVVDGEIKDAGNGAAYVWLGDENNTGAETLVTDKATATVSVTLTNGMTVAAIWSGEEDGTVRSAWTVSLGEIETPEAYAPYTVPAVDPTSKVNDAEWKYTVNGADVAAGATCYAGAAGSNLTITAALYPVIDGEVNTETALLTVSREYTVGETTAVLPDLSLKANTAFNVPAVQTTAAYAPGAEWKYTANGASTSAGAKLYAGAEGSTVTITATLCDGDEELLAVSKDYTVAAYDAAVSSSQLTVGGAVITESNTETVWYSTEQTVTATVTMGQDVCELPAGVAATGFDGQLTKSVDNVWSVSKTLTNGMTGTFTLNNGAAETTAMVGVDTVVPTVSITDVTYNRPQGKNGKWSVTITGTYTVGASGIDTFTINGYTVTASDGTFTCTFEVDPPKPGNNNQATEEWTAVLTNKAGTSNATDNQGQETDVAYLKADIAYKKGEKAGNGTDGNYYDADGSITITLYSTKPNKLPVTGADVVAKDAAGKDIAVTFNNNVATISTANGISELTVQPKNDSDSNNVKYGEMETFDRVIAADTTAPTAVGSTENADVQYKGEETDYTVTITEALLESGSLTFRYADEKTTVIAADDFTKGEDGTYTYTIKVTNGQHLTTVDVNVTDCAGHNLKTTLTPNIKVDTEAPVVTMKMGTNVTGFYKDQEDRYFAILDKGTHSGKDTYADEKVAVTMTVVIKDFSLAASSVTDVTDAEGEEDWSITTDDAGWSTMTKTFSWNVDQYTSAALAFDFTVVDLAGNSESTTSTPVQPGVKPTEGEAQTSMPVTPEAGQYKGTILVDRRAPSDPSTEIKQAPKVTLNADEESTVADRKLYNGNGDDQLVFEMNVSDLYITSYETDADGNEIPVYSTNDAGLKLEVDTSITGGGLTTAESVNLTVDDTGTGTAQIVINIPENTEVNGATLTVTISDNVGNTYYYVDTFDVDNQAPRVTLEYDENNAINNTYYAAYRTATVTVEDLNLDSTTITVNGEKFNGTPVIEGIKYTYTVPFETDGDYKLVINAVDHADHSAVEVTDSFTVDTTDPMITIEKNKIAPVQSNETHDYYAGQVTYTVTASDTNFQEATLSYTIDGVTTETALESGKDVIIKVNNGQVLTDIQVKAQDKASRYGKTKNLAFTFNEETGVWTYNGHDVVVDTDPAEVTLTKTADAYKQTYKNVDYYQGNVKYSLEISDKFMTVEEGKVQLELVYQNETKTLLIDELNLTKSETANVYTTEFEVKNGQCLQAINILVQDNSGNITKTVTCEDGENLTSFAFDSETDENAYAGNPIVVDTTLPEVKLAFSENVNSVYVNGTTVYAVLATPTKAESGIFSTQKGEEVTVTITVTDKNVSIDNENVYGVKTGNTFKWDGQTPVNTESAITYTAKSGEIKADGTAVFEIDVAIADLAGNIPVDFTSEITMQDGSVLPVVVDDKTGAINYTVSVDRLRPSSESSDTAAPTITIKPSIEPTKTASGLDLFNGAFSFAMNVTDGKNDLKNSGLASVKWIIEDGKDLVEVGELGREYTEQTFDDTFTINVPAPATPGESNDITLTITAIDNVGNTITYVKEFGMDTLAPRVTITQSNHDVKNEFYFNADQVVTVQIEDLNFDSTKSTVTTEVPFGGWASIGDNKYSTTLTYNTDGDYTFAMATTDLANNAATIDYTTGLTALQSFTIDKTAPVIHVTFNPANPVDTDGNMVQYFDNVRTVTVTIDEHNFRAADVVANLGAANALGAWATNGDSHTASEMFNEGNGYSVSVNYTDLAGNPAAAYTSPTFSIDLEAPVIEMNKGNMATGTLNIVPDDLALGFSITDNQDNLKSFAVEVIHLNNNYQQTKVEGAEYYTVTEGDRTTGYIDFTNIDSVKANDGIYTVRVTALDYAGHAVNFPDVVFSLNRFGSTFTVSDSYTSSFLTADGTGIIYQNQVAGPLVITEVNPNRVWQDAAQSMEGSAITVAANGNSVTLVAGQDYEVSVAEMGTGSNKWFEYTYTINPDVFNQNDELVDGEYTIFFYSEDEAGNKNTNESNEGSALLLGSDGNYSGKVSFTLDHKAPVVTVLNIEEGGQYVEANKNVEINVADNSPVSIAVYINDVLVEYVDSADGQPLTSDWLTYDAESGNYVLNMSEKDKPQDVRVVVTDAAGNVYEQIIGDITLTENLWIQFINNTPLVIGSIVGVIGLFILIILLLRKRKKKEETAEV